MDLNETHKDEIAFLVKHADKNLPEVLRMFAKEYYNKQLALCNVSCQREQLPTNEEINEEIYKNVRLFKGFVEADKIMYYEIGFTNGVKYAIDKNKTQGNCS